MDLNPVFNRVGVHLRWGVRVTTPSGGHVFEPRDSQAEACQSVTDLNELEPDLARLAMQEVIVGAWFDSLDGNVFGMRTAWAIGDAGEHEEDAEYHPAGGRDAAEAMVERYEGTGVPSVASRWIVAGDWVCVGSDVAS